MLLDERFWKVLSGSVTCLDRAALTLGALCVTGFAGIVIYVVFARYMLSYTPYWAEELPRMLLVWVTFIGSISGFARDSHFRAGILGLLLPSGGARRLLRRIAAMATLIFLGVLAVTGWQLTQVTWSHQTTALSWPVGLLYLALPVCCGLSMIPAVAILIRGRSDDD